MAKQGKDFELAYTHLYSSLDKEKYMVTNSALLNSKINNKKREVDVLVEYTDEQGKLRRIGIECRDRKGMQDVTWVEQMATKKEILGLDSLILTTTSTFSQSAIDTANYFGIILEQADFPRAEKIEELAKTTYADFYFYKFTFEKLNFYKKDTGKVSFKELIKGLNFIDYNSLIYHLNTDFYYSFDPLSILEDGGFSLEDFFKYEKSEMVIKGENFYETEPPCSLKDVVFFDWEIEILPLKVSLPILKSLSTYDAKNLKNKNYIGDFKDGPDSFTVGYLDKELIVEFNLRPRKYCRCAGGSMNLNTIFPDNIDFDCTDCLDFIMENHMGEFDFSKII